MAFKKRPAVQNAVGELGMDAKPAEVAKWVKDKYGLDLTDGVAMSYTSWAKKKLKEERRSLEAAPMVAPTPKAAVIVRPKSTLDDLLLCMEQMRGIVKKIGADGARKLLDNMSL
jgi:hypothetical protein